MLNEKKYVSMLKKQDTLNISKHGNYFYIMSDYSILKIHISNIKKTLSDFIYSILNDFDISHDFDIEYSKSLNNVYPHKNNLEIIDLVTEFHLEEREELLKTTLLTEHLNELLNIFVSYSNKEYIFISKNDIEMLDRRVRATTYKKLVRFKYYNQDTAYYIVKKCDFGINKKFLKSLEG